MELCLTQYWSELKDASVSLTMTFHSLHPSKPALHFVSQYLILRLVPRLISPGRYHLQEIKASGDKPGNEAISYLHHSLALTCTYSSVI